MEIIVIGVLVVFLVAVFVTLESWVIMLLWNWLMPLACSEDGTGYQITFWQAVGIWIALSLVGSAFRFVVKTQGD